MTSTITRDQFVSFRTIFRARSNSKQTNAAEHLLNNIICGAPITRGFSLVTNIRKLTNGQVPDASLTTAFKELRWAVRRYETKKETTIFSYQLDEATIGVIGEAANEYFN